MKKVSLLLILLAVLGPCTATGDLVLGAGSNSTTVIKAAIVGNATSTRPFGRLKSPETQHKAAAELSTLNSISVVSLVYDSREDTFEDPLVEKVTEQRNAVRLAIFNAIEIILTIRILIFPFHFFL